MPNPRNQSDGRVYWLETSTPPTFPALADDLTPGQAAIVSLDEADVAAFRDDKGDVHAVAAVCTHMGCVVGWNGTDRTWDCPCHGSRFAVSGEVLNGPAVAPLERWQAN